MPEDVVLPAPASRPKPGLPWLGLLAILALTSIAYSQSLQNGLTNWDDDGYVLRNPWFGHYSWAAVQSMFSGFYKANYHPLTLLSLYIDHAIGGGQVAWYHVVNLILHLTNTALAALVALRLSGRISIALIVAALFGLHPIHVESVAWISERKDVLHAFFYLASLSIYIRSVRSDRARNRYALWVSSWLLFAAALLSKGTAVSLAPTLFIVDALLGRRLLSLRVGLEKLPFFALALVSGMLTLAAQSAVGQLEGVSQWSLLERIALAGTAYCHYLALLVAPYGLSAFHPYPARIEGALPAIFWLGPIGFLAVQALSLAAIRRLPLVAFGLLFFTINIALMLQLIPIGGALVAERYAYVPSLGFFLAVTAAGSALLEHRRVLRRPAAVALTLYGLALGGSTWQRTEVWQDSLHLWDDTLARHPDIPVARLNRALARREVGDLRGALSDLDAAIAANPRYAKAFGHRGVLRFEAGDLQAGLKDLDRALMIEPTVEAYRNRGALRLASNDLVGALADLDRAIQADPGQPVAWSNRGLAQLAAGRFGAAVGDFEQALRLLPGHLPALIGRAEARLGLGSHDRALAEADAILASYPDLAAALWIRAQALRGSGRHDAACQASAAAARAGNAAAAEAFATECSK